MCVSATGDDIDQHWVHNFSAWQTKCIRFEARERRERSSCKHVETRLVRFLGTVTLFLLSNIEKRPILMRSVVANACELAIIISRDENLQNKFFFFCCVRECVCVCIQRLRSDNVWHTRANCHEVALSSSAFASVSFHSREPPFPPRTRDFFFLHTNAPSTRAHIRIALVPFRFS